MKLPPMTNQPKEEITDFDVWWCNLDANEGPTYKQAKEFYHQVEQSAVKRTCEETLQMFREYKTQYPNANWDDAIGLLMGTKIFEELEKKKEDL